MYFKIVLFVCTLFIFPIKSSVVPVAPSLSYRLVTPQNVRPFASQVSTFTKGLNVLDAPWAAGVLNPPAIISRGVPLPPAPVPLVHGPAPLVHGPAHLAAPAHLAPPAPVLSAPIFAPAPFAPPAGVFPAPAGVLPAPVPGAVPAHLAYPAPLHPLAVPAALPAPVGVYPGHPAHVLPFPGARSVHAVGPAAPVNVW